VAEDPPPAALGDPYDPLPGIAELLAVIYPVGQSRRTMLRLRGGIGIEPHRAREAAAWLGKLREALAPQARAVNAALRFHERTALYGNAATEGEPGNCPHDPDDALHFEGDGEWLCEGRPEGAVCSTCTEDGLPVAWPCPEYAAITAALGPWSAQPPLSPSTATRCAARA
jgi:hypothetical protein